MHDFFGHGPLWFDQSAFLPDGPCGISLNVRIGTGKGSINGRKRAAKNKTARGAACIFKGNPCGPYFDGRCATSAKSMSSLTLLQQISAAKYVCCNGFG